MSDAIAFINWKIDKKDHIYQLFENIIDSITFKKVNSEWIFKI